MNPDPISQFFADLASNLYIVAAIFGALIFAVLF